MAKQGKYEQLLSSVIPSDWVIEGSRKWRHVSGVLVRYNHNKWMWEVVGSTNADGYFYNTKWAAQSAAITSGVTHDR